MTVLAGALAVLAGACGSDDDDGNSGGDGSSGEVALATSTSLKSGYGKALEIGADQIETELDYNVDIAEQVAPADFVTRLQDFGTRGYDLVMLDGADWQEATLQVAPEFPDSFFVIVNGFQPQSPNVAAIDFEFEQSGFLAGEVAALVSKSNKVAQIGGVELPPLARLYHGFEQGVRYVNQEAKTSVSYTGSFTDTGKAAQVTEAQLSSGVDVLWAIAANANAGIYQAAKDGNAVAIGYGVDDRANAPGNLVTTATVDYPKVFLEAAREFSDGTLEPTLQTEGFDQGVLGLGPFGDFVPESVVAEATEIEEKAKNGEITIERMPGSG